MPQIAQLAETFSSQAFWLLVFFGISFFVVGRGMVPKVSGTMERRSKQIADDIAAAQAARDQADQEEEAWRVRENENRARAQALIAEAKAKAAAERIVTESGIDWTIFRPSSFIGAGHGLPWGVPGLIRALGPQRYHPPWLFTFSMAKNACPSHMRQ